MMRPGVMFCLCYFIVACGGGSDAGLAGKVAPITGIGETLTTAAPQAALTPAPTLAPISLPASALEPGLVATSTGIDTSCGLNGPGGIQAEVLQIVNTVRAAGAVCGATAFGGTAPLNWNSMLLQAATGHSRDMAQSNTFSHTSPDGRTMVERIGATGYNLTAAGENIAAGQATVKEVMASWINSPGHCRNLMNPAYRDIGVACMRNDAASYGHYWTMDLGRP